MMKQKVFYHLLMVLLGCLINVGCTGGLSVNVEPLDNSQHQESNNNKHNNINNKNNECESYQSGKRKYQRLTPWEYKQSLLTVFPGLNVNGVDLPSTTNTTGFNSNALLTLKPQDMKDYLESAQILAERIMTQQSRYNYQCNGEHMCILKFLQDKGALLYRRALTEEELTRLMQRFKDNQSKYDSEFAQEALLTQLLVSQNFLHLVEIGRPAPSLGKDVIELTPQELAARLSYTLWGTGPDRELLDAAEHLNDLNVYDAQIQRMLKDERFLARMWYFTSQWFGINDLEFSNKHEESVARALKEEARLYVRSVFANDKSNFKGLLLSDYSYLNGVLLEFYGFGSNNQSNFQRVSFEPKDKRGGLLRQAGVIAAHTKDDKIAHITRGDFVIKSLMCADEIIIPQGIDTTQGGCDSNPSCMNCHNFIEPPGYAFDNYSADGRIRTQRNDGQPIDTSGYLLSYAGGDPTNGPQFADLKELAQLIADNDRAKACLPKKFLSFANGRTALLDEDFCVLDSMKGALGQNSGDIKTMLVAMLKHENFRFRRINLEKVQSCQ